MSAAETYRRRAASCILLAEESPQPASRLELMQMAQSWLLLALQAEKNSETDVARGVGRRTPSPREAEDGPAFAAFYGRSGGNLATT
jgi:hypothetical protein